MSPSFPETNYEQNIKAQYEYAQLAVPDESPSAGAWEFFLSGTALLACTLS